MSAEVKKPLPMHSPEAIKKRVATLHKQHRVRDMAIVKKRIEGKSNRTIAKEITREFAPITHQRVDYILSRDDIKPIMEKQYLKIMGVVPEVTDRIIAKSRALDENLDDKINQPICWEANKLLAQTAGILIAPNQTNIQNTFITQNNNIVPPVIQDLMKKYFGDIIDIKPLDMKEIEDAADAQG